MVKMDQEKAFNVLKEALALPMVQTHKSHASSMLTHCRLHLVNPDVTQCQWQSGHHCLQLQDSHGNGVTQPDRRTRDVSNHTEIPAWHSSCDVDWPSAISRSDWQQGETFKRTREDLHFLHRRLHHFIPSWQSNGLKTQRMLSQMPSQESPSQTRGWQHQWQ